MLSPGGLETLEHVTHYGTVILVMWAMMAAWIVWNQKRYGKHNRRHKKAPVVSTQQVCDYTKLSSSEVDHLRTHKEVYLHYDEEDHPVIDENVEPLEKHQKRAAV